MSLYRTHRVMVGLIGALALGLGVITTAAGAASAADLSAKVLPYTVTPQEQSNWCVSATSAQIETYAGYPITTEAFCQIANGITDGSACPNDPIGSPELYRGFAGTGFGYKEVQAAKAKFSDVVANINANEPMELGISWKSGGGHLVSIYGYRVAADGTQYVDIGNTLPVGSSSYNAITGEVSWKYLFNNKIYSINNYFGSIAKI